MIYLCSFLLLSIASGADLDPALRRSLRSQTSANIIVSMKGGVAPAVDKLQFQTFASRTQRLEALSDELIAIAESSQQSVLDILSQEKRIASSYESFWISNSIYIADASSELIQKLTLLPNVEEIHQEHMIQLDRCVKVK